MNIHSVQRVNLLICRALKYDVHDFKNHAHLRNTTKWVTIHFHYTIGGSYEDFIYNLYNRYVKPMDLLLRIDADACLDGACHRIVSIDDGESWNGR